ncbi:hypothetical protein MUK42_19149 [Musa troglodytarum]|uniref:Uncharacterized protein n=1 Tax=Musa troglodytarum TaxID=320322 RepID=A0A9E7FSF0_9LILI|nr:hypothetical protein MUK42_19149 [Musa troglodytarum]
MVPWVVMGSLVLEEMLQIKIAALAPQATPTTMVVTPSTDAVVVTILRYRENN